MESRKPITAAERKMKSRESLKSKLSDDEFDAYKIKECKRIAEASKKSRNNAKL